MDCSVHDQRRGSGSKKGRSEGGQSERQAVAHGVSKKGGRSKMSPSWRYTGSCHLFLSSISSEKVSPTSARQQRADDSQQVEFPSSYLQQLISV